MAVSVHLLHRLPMVSRGAAPVDAKEAIYGMEEAGGPDRRANGRQSTSACTRGLGSSTAFIWFRDRGVHPGPRHRVRKQRPMMKREGLSEIPNFDLWTVPDGACYVRSSNPRPDLWKPAGRWPFGAAGNAAGDDGSLREQVGRNTLLVFPPRANGQRFLPRDAAGATGLPHRRGRARSGDERPNGWRDTSRRHHRIVKARFNGKRYVFLAPLRHPHQVVDSSGKGEGPTDSSDSTMTSLAQPGDGLEPAEDLFHPGTILLATG
jgi:hypothetical protein